jgi:transcriptional regulator with XRE-family HTH domain
MKKDMQMKAKKLRKDLGLSIKKIADILNVSKGSVSLWVRDIELSEEQKQKLSLNNPAYNKQCLGAKVRKLECEKIRLEYQNQGKLLAKSASPLFVMGCMLYWAEGSKRKNSITFCNSDVSMMKIFMKFLREELKVQNEDIKLSFNAYLSNGINFDHIKKYWLNNLNLNENSLNKCQINNTPISSKKYKTNNLPYGCATVMVHKTELVQKIFGAIQHFGDIEVGKWI